MNYTVKLETDDKQSVLVSQLIKPLYNRWQKLVMSLNL
jgi:hypothetical protein